MLFSPEIQTIVDSCERIMARYEREYMKHDSSDLYTLEFYQKIIEVKTRKVSNMLAKRENVGQYSL